MLRQRFALRKGRAPGPDREKGDGNAALRKDRQQPAIMPKPVNDSAGVWLRQAAARLAAAGVDQPQRQARLLLARHSGLPAERLMAFPETPVADEPGFRMLLERRAAGEPLSRILGLREFYGLPFLISPAVLDPRADSETLVDAALTLWPNRHTPLKIADFGTGSGCLLQALLSVYPAARGWGIDRSATALAVARHNAAALGLTGRCRFARLDWADAARNAARLPWRAPFDLLAANPPYISHAGLRALPPEVAGHDPAMALDGGVDGLTAYRRLLPAARLALRRGGWLLLELGAGQAPQVHRLLRQAGFGPPRRFRDLAGRARVLAARRV